MYIKIYQFITVLFSPIIDLFMLIRLMMKKESKQRFLERFGYTQVARPEGKIIWFQCASVGESNSALPLIYKIIEKYEEKVTVLLTSGTVTSNYTISKKIAGKTNIIHQFTPIDKYFVIKRFLKHWQPDALITVESEIWPNMITMTHKLGKKVMIVNAKISEKSYNRWKAFKGLKESVFDSIDICYPQSLDDQHRLINLGIQNTVYLGNLKFDIPKLKINPEFLDFLKESFKGRRVVCCASTHEKEEEILVEVYKKLRDKFSDLIFLVAIRHPNRSNEVYNLFQQNGLNVKRKSCNEVIDLETNIYMYDEMGEMGTIYEASDIVLMCGSLTPGRGGHTPVEPAKHMCAIFTGPYIKNNKSLFVELEKNNACIICKEQETEEKFADELYNTAYSLITDAKLQNSLKENAAKTCEKFSHVADDVAKNVILNLQ